MAPARTLALALALPRLSAGVEALEVVKDCQEDVKCLMEALTLEEKLNFFAGDLDAIDHIKGVKRLNIPEINMGDGPNGVANTIAGTATSFPCNKAIGDTWDRDVTRKYATAMSKEFKAKGKNMLLGPGVNLARVPQCGRMDEYISGEDPTLGAELVKAFVLGALDEHVMVNIKHYGNNEQETNRNNWSANPDANIQMEYYSKPFRAGIEVGAASIMCAYNKVGGVPACKNKDLLLAAKSWGDGFFIVSDWGAIYPDAANGGAAEYINAGVDVEMGAHDDAECTGPDVPETEYGGAGYCNKGDYMLPDRMQKMLDSGAITKERIDETVSRILKALKTAGLLNPAVQAQFPVYEHKDYHSKWYGPLSQKDVRTQNSRQVAQEVARKALVLVQNHEGLLPVEKKGAKVAMYGCSGDEVHFHAESGSASGTAPHFPKVPCQANGLTACPWPEDAFRAAGADVNAYKFAEGSAGPKDADADAVTVVCLMAKSFNTEGTDRSTLEMQPFPFEKFQSGRLVVWAVAPGPVILDFAAKVDALLVTSLPGEMGGGAFADIFFGDASPAAHLTMSMPQSMSDTSVKIHQNWDNYDEGFEMGYRYYSAKETYPVFPFGWGLSYAKYMRVLDADFKLSKKASSTGKDRIQVTLKLLRDANDHDFAGAVDQVVQLYVQHEKPTARPFKELIGFDKVNGLKAGTSGVAVIEFDAPETWASAVGDKTGYAAGWNAVAEYSLFLSLYGVEDTRPLFQAKRSANGTVDAKSQHDFAKGPMDFDQQKAVYERAKARSLDEEKPAAHKWSNATASSPAAASSPASPPSLPALPALPVLPALPAQPSLPAMPALPALPAAPAVAAPPSLAPLPKLPALPALPAMPTMAPLPTMSMPKLPEAPAPLGVSVSPVPPLKVDVSVSPVPPLKVDVSVSPVPPLKVAGPEEKFSASTGFASPSTGASLASAICGFAAISVAVAAVAALARRSARTAIRAERFDQELLAFAHHEATEDESA